MNDLDLVKEITDQDFDSEVLNSTIPVLVDFWAPWCGPCRMVAPVLKKIAPDFVGKATIVKYNVDENTTYGAKYNIQSIPALILFKDGVVFEMKVGAQPEAKLRDFINSALV